MTSVTNLTREPVHFTVGSKDGEPIVEAVGPGETRNIKLPADHPKIQARVNAGLIALGETTRTERAASTKATKGAKRVKAAPAAATKASEGTEAPDAPQS